MENFRWKKFLLLALVSSSSCFLFFSRVWASFVLLFLLFSFMFSSKNDMSCSTRRVIPLVSLVLGPRKRRLEDYPIKTFRTRFLFFQNNSRKFFPFLRSFESSHPFFPNFFDIDFFPLFSPSKHKHVFFNWSILALEKKKNWSRWLIAHFCFFFSSYSSVCCAILSINTVACPRLVKY